MRYWGKVLSQIRGNRVIKAQAGHFITCLYFSLMCTCIVVKTVYYTRSRLIWYAQYIAALIVDRRVLLEYKEIFCLLTRSMSSRTTPGRRKYCMPCMVSFSSVLHHCALVLIIVGPGVAYTTLQTAVFGASPLSTLGKLFGKKGAFTRQCHLPLFPWFCLQVGWPWRGQEGGVINLYSAAVALLSSSSRFSTKTRILLLPLCYWTSSVCRLFCIIHRTSANFRNSTAIIENCRQLPCPLFATVAYTTIQTTMSGTSPLSTLGKLFSKKGDIY